jgi:hypothetical protein
MTNTDITLNIIYKDLELIKNKVINIEENMINRDAILTKGEEILLKKAREEHKQGKTISLEQLEKEMD